jgi:hypothetical protein
MMNTVTPQTFDAAPFSEGGCLLYIKISHPLDQPALSRIFPGHNRIGCQLLAALIKARLRLADIDCHFSAGVGPLDRAKLIAEVREWQPAIETIKEVLREEGLLGCAQHIAWLDEREGILRDEYPTRGPCMEIPMDQFRAEEDLNKQIVAWVKETEEGGTPS